MPWSRVIQSAVAPRVALFLLPFLFWYGIGNREWGTPGYWASATGQASTLLFLVVPACALSAAWEAGRLRRARPLLAAAARTPLRIAAQLLVLPMLLGVAGMGVALLVQLPDAWGAPGGPSPLLPAMWLAVIAAHSTAGLLLGRWLPAPVALPLAVAGSYLVIAYPPAMQPVWLRHLVGNGLDSCCALDRVPSERATLAAAVVSAGVVMTVALLVHVGRRAVAGAVALCVLAGSFTAGWALANRMGPDAVTPRSEAALLCSGGDPEVCVWPEQRPQAQRIEAEVRDAYEALRRAGMELPERVSSAAEPGALRIRLEANPSARDIARSLAGSVIPAEVPPCAQLPEAEYPGYAAYEPLMAWSLLVITSDPAIARAHTEPQSAELAQRVRRELTREEQLQWFEANAASLRDCSLEPVLAAEVRP